MNQQGELIFTLDIGTRTVIGLIIEPVNSTYQILSSRIVEHDRRAMLDGQIHNVREVTNLVKKIKKSFEEELGITLEKVSIAAAGRSLETVSYLHKIELENRRLISAGDVQRLEFSAIRQAQISLAEKNPAKPFQNYHFVGYSVVEYQLDDMFIGDLEGHTGKNLAVKIIATFLPRVVIDSLLAVINQAGLMVDYLTLEPIAAANVVIPRDMYGFNLALVDIGAGTSDIALTSKGTMVGYDMVPVAGDELTEALAGHFLLDYQTGEKIKRQLQGDQSEFRVKNILSQEITIERKEALTVIKPVVQSLAIQIAEAILSLNKKSPQALICIGGGSLTPGLLSSLAEVLEIDPGRVGLKKYEDINNVQGDITGISSSQAVTPVGIAVSAFNNRDRANFLEVSVNGRSLQLFTLEKARVADALLAADIDHKTIQGRNGKGLTCNVNGELKIVKGTLGKPGKITLNQKETTLETTLKPGDEIIVEPGKNGEDASAVIADVIPEFNNLEIFINDREVVLTPDLSQNGNPAHPEDPLLDGARIEYTEFQTIRDGLAFYYQVPRTKINNSHLTVSLNGVKKKLGTEGFFIRQNGEPVEIDHPLVSGLKLQVEKNTGSFKLAELIPESKLQITLNGRELTIPAHLDIKCNGKKISSEYQVKDGDNISYQVHSVSIRDVFSHLSFRLPENLANYRLTLNHKPVSLTEHLENGDHLKLDLR